MVEDPSAIRNRYMAGDLLSHEARPGLGLKNAELRVLGGGWKPAHLKGIDIE